METTEEYASVTYEDLAAIEDEFDEIDTQIMRKQHQLSTAAYARRTAATSKIPNFWPLVLEQAPLEIDQFVQPQDSKIFTESLTGIEVTRPELERDPERGNPRSVRIKFTFKANEYFEDEELTKTFWQRRAQDGWTGLVSEPVRIRWKKDKDLSKGLTELACAVFEERRKAAGDDGGMSSRKVPSYAKLKKAVQSWNGMNTSFFTWFGWVSGRRWVSAEESEKANREEVERKKKRKAGEQIVAAEEEQDEQDGEDGEDDSDIEVHQAGDELALSFAEELWPSAIKLFTQAQEMDDISDADFEDDEMEGAEDVDEDDDEDGPVDIRSLVQGKGDRTRSRESSGPATKKQKR